MSGVASRRLLPELSQALLRPGSPPPGPGGPPHHGGAGHVRHLLEGQVPCRGSRVFPGAPGSGCLDLPSSRLPGGRAVSGTAKREGVRQRLRCVRAGASRTPVPGEGPRSRPAECRQTPGSDSAMWDAAIGAGGPTARPVTQERKIHQLLVVFKASFAQRPTLGSRLLSLIRGV